MGDSVSSSLREQYESLTLEELEGIRANAVLDKNAKQILLEVISEKKKNDGSVILRQLQKEETTNKKFEYALENNDFSLLEPDEIKYLSSRITLTTETYMPDMPIAERLEVITAECVYGMNLFRDFFSTVRDVFGGRSRSSQKVLRDARKVCLDELKQEALLVGADAVVGIDLDYSEISGGAKSMLFIVASGTAVKLKKS